LRVRLVVAGGVLAIVVGIAVLTLRSATGALDDATDKRGEVRLAIATVTQVQTDVLDLETGLRGFVITHRAQFLQPWIDARRSLPGDLARLRRGVPDEPADRALATTLASASAAYLRDYTEPVIDAVRRGRPDASSDTTTAAGKQRVDRLRRIVDRLRSSLTTQAAALSAQADGKAHDASSLGIGALLGLSGLIVLFIVYLLRGMAVPIRRVCVAAENLAAGDMTARAPERGVREIARLGASFNRMASTIARNSAEMDARNRELAVAKEEADRANQAKSEFLSRMSHELRTPLNAVLGFAQLLEFDHLSDDQKESVQQIERAGRHLLYLIDEVLDIARVDTGELRLSPEPTGAAELIAEAISLVAPLAEQRSIRLVADDTGAGGGHVIADRQRLKQILLNLLSNAIKYNREAGEVRIALHANGDARLAISVTDTGAGLSEQQLCMLFEPFERLGAEHRNIEGTGLGLALSRRLAEAMEGTIEVQSTPGEGSTFSVHLPAATARVHAEADDEHVAQQPICGERKILYIEDNLSNLRLVERVLARRSKVTFLPAMQGRIGLELAREHRPDLVLLDLHLPDLRGDEVLIRLKAEPVTRQTPVIMLSADASPGQVQRLREAGAAAYLTKPINLQELLDAVGRHLHDPAGDGA
jgi:signal transduction histidine kinase/ActR/RegA family two-component response regulator